MPRSACSVALETYCTMVPVVFWGAGFECSVMFVAFLVHDPMICLDRRVVLHWKHTMVHLLSF
jgi:hypothetical protein